MTNGFDHIVLPICNKKNGTDVVEDYNFNRFQIAYFREYNESGKSTKSALFVVGNKRPFIVNMPIDKLLIHINRLGDKRPS